MAKIANKDFKNNYKERLLIKKNYLFKLKLFYYLD